MSTPVTNLYDELVSQGVPPETAIKAARTLEAKLNETTTSSVSSEKERERWRLKKQRQRAKKGSMSPAVHGGTSPSGYISTNSQTHLLESKKDTSHGVSCPPGDKTKCDDWPDDYREQFWAMYPPGRKHEKAKVFARLEKLRGEGYLDAYKKRQRLPWATLIGGLRRLVSTQPDPTFTPAPIVWLTGHRWDADYGDRISKQGATNEAARSGDQRNFGFGGISAQLRARQSAG